MKRFVQAIGILGILLAAGPAARADTLCTTTLFNAVINGNLIVPDGAGCSLSNATVTGNVLVGRGASFEADGNVTISGNLQADHCTVAILDGVNGPISVGGNVEIQQCTGPEASGYFGSSSGLTIGGNFHCHNNSARCEAVSGSIGGNADVSNNSGTSSVESNTIGGSLQCVGNDSINAGGNTVAGQKRGQCAAL